MNSTRFVRGMMSKSIKTEVYLKHVAETIGRQLEKWDKRYEVKLYQDLLDEASYEVIVTLEDVMYHVHLELPTVAVLQDRSHTRLIDIYGTNLKIKA